jgi:hypothetical protein
MQQGRTHFFVTTRNHQKECENLLSKYAEWLNLAA